jgi:hypothetical protein
LNKPLLLKSKRGFIQFPGRNEGAPALQKFHRIFHQSPVKMPDQQMPQYPTATINRSLTLLKPAHHYLPAELSGVHFKICINVTIIF